MAVSDLPAPRWVKVLDQSRCIGCHACTTACKSENEVPVGVTRTYVKSVDVGVFPQVRRVFQVTRCNQCEDAPCVAACPTRAMYRREDGIVDFDKSICIGCKACMAACPYDAIFINPEDHSAEKCNMCAHRLDMGLEPACVTVCPTEAILVGDLNDPASKVAQTINREPVQVRRPEKNTRPGVFYKGAHAGDAGPAGGPPGPTAGCSRGPPRARRIRSSSRRGHPGRTVSSAAALLSYDVPHQAPWGWRVSLYTWTKSVAAGGFAVPVALAFAGLLRLGKRRGALGRAAAGAGVPGGDRRAADRRPQAPAAIPPDLHPASLAELAGARGVHPRRFRRRRGRCYLLAALAGSTGARQVLGGLGLPLAAGAAVYTAYLFAQAKARDMWQSPLLAPHLAVQATLAGAAATLPLLAWLAPGRAVTADEVILAAAAAAHLALAAGEITLPHVTAHARLAVEEMSRGRHRRPFGLGMIFIAVAVAAPWIGTLAAPFALAGLLAYEHAYVQAGQSVPLA